MKDLIEAKEYVSATPEQTFELGLRIGETLAGNEVILLSGGLGAGKTLLTKGIVTALGFDEDEVNSPSFTLVNIYPTAKCNVYHIDLWRLDEEMDIIASTNLDEIIAEESVVIIEWAEKLKNVSFGLRRVIRIHIEGEGEETRKIFVNS